MNGILLILSIVLVSCTPILKYETMQSALLNPPVREIRNDPLAYQGRLFVFGGIIVDTRVTEEGSLIEGVFVPVDARGYLLDPPVASDRFLALYPRTAGVLDPMVFKKGREVTVAGNLTALKKSRFEEMEYIYPLFSIVEIYLWDRAYTPYRPYPNLYWWYDPWWYGPGPRYYWWR